jgi:gas vesicle protein
MAGSKAVTQQMLTNAEARMKQRIDALKGTLKQQLQQLEKGMKKWMEEKSVPQPTVKQEVVNIRRLSHACFSP